MKEQFPIAEQKNAQLEKINNHLKQELKDSTALMETYAAEIST
jgi:hypothetical protein